MKRSEKNDRFMRFVLLFIAFGLSFNFAWGFDIRFDGNSLLVTGSIWSFMFLLFSSIMLFIVNQHRELIDDLIHPFKMAYLNIFYTNVGFKGHTLEDYDKIAHMCNQKNWNYIVYKRKFWVKKKENAVLLKTMWG